MYESTDYNVWIYNKRITWRKTDAKYCEASDKEYITTKRCVEITVIQAVMHFSCLKNAPKWKLQQWALRHNHSIQSWIYLAKICNLVSMILLLQFYNNNFFTMKPWQIETNIFEKFPRFSPLFSPICRLNHFLQLLSDTCKYKLRL